MTQPTQPSISLADYWDLLTQHDWYYHFSDDHSVWRQGAAKYSQLRAIAGQSPDHGNLYHKFKQHHFSGKPWETEKQPLPARPDEIKKEAA